MWVRGDRGREVVALPGAERRVDALVRRGGVEADRSHVVWQQLRDLRVRVRAEVLPRESGYEAPVGDCTKRLDKDRFARTEKNRTR